MNVARSLCGAQQSPRARRRRRPADVPAPPIGNILLGKAVTIILAALAIGVAIATFMMLARGSPYGVRPGIGFGRCSPICRCCCCSGAVLAGRVTQVWVERRRGSAGSRLHVRLVLLFSVVAVAPTIVVAMFATAFFHFGIQAWFNDPRARRARTSRCRPRAAIWRSTRTTSARSRSRWPTISRASAAC